jgi:hypothetical protein
MAGWQQCFENEYFPKDGGLMVGTFLPYNRPQYAS